MAEEKIEGTVGTFSSHLTVSFEHRIYFTTGVFSLENPLLAKFVREHFPDSAIVAYCEEELKLSDNITAYCNTNRLPLKAIRTIKGGEAIKKGFFEFAQEEYSSLFAGGLKRSDIVIAVGGGAVLDSIGLLAALYHRGMHFIRIPTTVLSQDDSAMGVKNGIDFGNVKNGIGVFAVPDAVICDFDFLYSLPQRHFVSGFAEAVKVGILKDRSLVGDIASRGGMLGTRNRQFVEDIVMRSAKCHFAHITAGGDPFERSNWRPLDYGHWLAHRLEVASDYAVSHGEAVCIGVAVDTGYAMAKGFGSKEEYSIVMQALRHCGLDDAVESAKESLDDGVSLLKGLEDFNNHLGGDFSLAMPSGLGNCREISVIDETCMLAAINDLRSAK